MPKVSIEQSIANCMVALETKLTDARKRAELAGWEIYGQLDLNERTREEGAEAQATIGHIEPQLSGLRDIQSWLSENRDVTNMLDGALNHHAGTAQRRQAIFISVLVITALIVGWLLSAAIPTTGVVPLLAHLFGH